MPTYCGIDGVVRQLKEWPAGVGGAVRQQKEVWAGVDGVNRKIFSSAPKNVVFTLLGDSGGLASITVNGSSYSNAAYSPLQVEYNTLVTCSATNQSGRGGIYVDGVNKGTSYSFYATQNLNIYFSLVVQFPSNNGRIDITST